MKRNVLFAAVLMVSGSVCADPSIITFDSSWRADGDTASAITGESSTGVTMDRSRAGTVIDGNNRVYQESADLTGSNGKTLARGETLVWSFDVTPVDIVAAADRDFRFSVWDQDFDGFSGRVDWGAAGGTFVQLGWKSDANGTGYIGAYNANVTSADKPSLDLGQTASPVHFELSITKNNTTSINDVTLKIDDAVYTHQFVGVDAFNNVALVGFRMADDQASSFTVSNMDMQIVPEPATLGLIASVGVGVIVLRRVFMV